MKRRELGLTPPSGPRYSADEDAIIRKFYAKLSALEVSRMLVGRTEKNVAYRAARIGIKGTRRGPKYATKARLSHMPRKVNITPEQIEAAVSRRYPAQVRQEVVQSLTVQTLEGLRLEDLPKAVRKQITATYAMFPNYGAPISLDAPAFDDAKTTIGDSIPAGTFHF